jgi:hypothetical protein
MDTTYKFGYPTAKRVVEIQEAVSSSHETYSEEYQGKYRQLPVVEVRIELLVYRIENIRTKSLQKEYLVQHPNLPRDYFLCDPFSIETQETQHTILKALANKENLLSTFKKDKLQQTEPLICSDDGVIVNGNRRLCAWRELFYSEPDIYKYFETIKVAVLPNHDPLGMYDLEVALQIRTPMKAEYTWHSIAADSKEKADQGNEISLIASKRNMSPEDIRTYIECYEYAIEYLLSIGHPDEWSLVDKQYFAFKQIVAGRKSLSKPGDKELFQEIAKAMLQIPAKGDSLYTQIPKVVNNLVDISPKLQEVFDILVEDFEEDDLSILTGGDAQENSNINSQIAAGIRIAENPELVIKTVKIVIEAQNEIEKEKKKKSFIFDQVIKAATNLNNAISNLNDTMSKDGIAKQLENIEAACIILKDWIR